MRALDIFFNAISWSWGGRGKIEVIILEMLELALHGEIAETGAAAN